MSRYLEEAARVLRKVEENSLSHDRQMDVANGFATLAAIDKGLLPADITADVIAAITARPTS